MVNNFDNWLIAAYQPGIGSYDIATLDKRLFSQRDAVEMAQDLKQRYQDQFMVVDNDTAEIIYDTADDE